MPMVLNKHIDQITAGAVYIGRGSKWGNPFVIGTHGDRNKVVELYCEWIIEQPNLMACLHEIRGKDLICFCAPKLCHGHILIEICEMI